MKIDNFKPKKLQEVVVELKEKSKNLKKQTSLLGKLSRLLNLSK